MSETSLPTIAILGAGPIGIEAAVYARYLGYPVTVYERGDLCDHVCQWGSVQMFTPFGMNCSPLGIAAITAQNTDYSPKPGVVGSGTATGGTTGSYVLSINVDRDPLSAQTTLALAVSTSTQTLIEVDDASQLPAVPFSVAIEDEHLLVTNVTVPVSGNPFLTVVRGTHDTTPISHPSGAEVTWLNDDNSSFDTAVDLGVLGAA